MFSTAWNWLVAQGFIKDVLSWVVGITLGALYASRRVIPLFRQHVRHQAKIADMLDTATPGGLTEVLKALGYQVSTEEDNIEPADGPDMPGTEPDSNSSKRAAPKFQPPKFEPGKNIMPPPGHHR